MKKYALLVLGIFFSTVTFGKNSSAASEQGFSVNHKDWQLVETRLCGAAVKLTHLQDVSLGLGYKKMVSVFVDRSLVFSAWIDSKDIPVVIVIDGDIYMDLVKEDLDHYVEQAIIAQNPLDAEQLNECVKS